MTIRVVLTDDQPLMRAAFRSVLEAAEMTVVGEAANGDEAVAVVRRVHPDVVLMDVRMPGRDGLSATAQLMTEEPRLRVLVLTRLISTSISTARSVPAPPAFFSKRLPGGADTRRANGGRRRERPRSGCHRADHGPLRPRAQQPTPPGSGRALGRSAGRAHRAREGRARPHGPRPQQPEIAGQLGVGEATTKTHVSRVLSKLAVRDRVQAVIYAYESGFAPTNRTPG